MSVSSTPTSTTSSPFRIATLSALQVETTSMFADELVMSRALGTLRDPLTFDDAGAAPHLAAVSARRWCPRIATMDTPKFPHHRDCEALTGITLDHLPRDGTLGRVRRFVKGAYLWQADDLADRIFFLRTGRVVVMTAKPHERPVALRTIEPNQPVGELCLCTVRTGVRGTTACALVASDVFEIKLNTFLGYLRQNRAALEA
jgi:hypothetical protein